MSRSTKDTYNSRWAKKKPKCNLENGIPINIHPILSCLSFLFQKPIKLKNFENKNVNLDNTFYLTLNTKIDSSLIYKTKHLEQPTPQPSTIRASRPTPQPSTIQPNRPTQPTPNRPLNTNSLTPSSKRKLASLSLTQQPAKRNKVSKPKAHKQISPLKDPPTLNEAALEQLKIDYTDFSTRQNDNIFPPDITHDDCMEYYKQAYDYLDYNKYIERNICCVCSIKTPCSSNPDLKIKTYNLNDESCLQTTKLISALPNLTHQLPTDLPFREDYIKLFDYDM